MDIQVDFDLSRLARYPALWRSWIGWRTLFGREKFGWLFTAFHGINRCAKKQDKLPPPLTWIIECHPFWRVDETMHMYGIFEGFPLSWCIVWVATAMTNVFNLASVKMMGICKERITSLYRWFRFRIVYIIEFVWTIFREDMLMVIYLCDGCFIYFYFTPKIENWGNDPFWRSYFSKGLVQPPISLCSKFTPTLLMQDAIHARSHRPVLLASSTQQWWWTWPIPSMYGIYTHIWLIFMVNVGRYTIHGSYGWFCVVDCGVINGKFAEKKMDPEWPFWECILVGSFFWSFYVYILFKGIWSTRR